MTPHPVGQYYQTTIHLLSRKWKGQTAEVLVKLEASYRNLLAVRPTTTEKDDHRRSNHERRIGARRTAGATVR